MQLSARAPGRHACASTPWLRSLRQTAPSGFAMTSIPTESTDVSTECSTARQRRHRARPRPFAAAQRRCCRWRWCTAARTLRGGDAVHRSSARQRYLLEELRRLYRAEPIQRALCFSLRSAARRSTKKRKPTSAPHAPPWTHREVEQRRLARCLHRPGGLRTRSRLRAAREQGASPSTGSATGCAAATCAR